MATCELMQVTGTNPCPYLMKIARRLVLVPTYDSEGNKNNFASPDEVTKANIQAKLDETEALDRFYALPLMENVEDTRAETTFFEWNSGQKVRIRSGARTFIGALPDGDPQFMERLQSWEGQSFGTYIIDADGNYVYADGTGEVNPISIDGNSWDVSMVKANDTEPFYIMIQFDFKQEVNDGHLRYIPINDLDFDGRTSDLYGLLPLVPKVDTTTAGTSTTVTVTTDYDVPVTGLVFGDFVLYDVTADSDLSVSDAVENPNVPGEYLLTSSTTVQGNVTRVTVSKLKYQDGVAEYTVT